jgi:hypothetical protein
MLSKTGRTMLGCALALMFVVCAGASTGVASTEGPCPNEALRQEQGSTGLPDCRAYEMVSPADKNGGDVASIPSRSRAAVDGNALAFPSLAAFAGAQGTGVSTEYVARRDLVAGTSGWSTHAITPLQDPLTAIAAALQQEGMYQDFSPDLSRGVFRAWSPLTNDPNVSQVENLYLRNDILSPGAGSYQLLTTATQPLGLGAVFEWPQFAAASADYSHLLFESFNQLTDDPVSGPALYESDHGTVRLAGILPDGTPAPTSEIGPGLLSEKRALGVMSADGSRIFFLVPDPTDPVCPSTGAHPDCGTVYMRVHHASTVQLNASEKSSPNVPPGRASFWTASSDGRRAFITTTEQLTEDDTNGVKDLYMYDADAPAGHHLTRLSVDHNGPEDFADGVIGASDDGHYVYFIAEGQLVAGKPDLGSGHHGVYLWHDGSLTFIGGLPDEFSQIEQNLNGPWPTNAGDARVSPDGRHVLFTADDGSQLLACGGGPCDSAGHTELYVYSADSNTLQCASCMPGGGTSGSDASAHVETADFGGTFDISHQSHALSDDGRYVFFDTNDALVPQDVNGRQDVYEFDADSGEVFLVSSGTSSADSFFLDASVDGRDVFFTTRQQLVGWDTDQNYDVYDARVDGGVAEPASGATPCAGDGCRGTPAAPPAANVPASQLLNGTGNVITPPKPPAGKVSKAQQLAKALKACRRKHGRTRRRCERATHRRYGPKARKGSVNTDRRASR